MSNSRLAAILLATTCAALPGASRAGTLTTLHYFSGDVTDGSQPMAALVSLGKYLYGTSYSGGKYGAGTLFSIASSTGAMSLIGSFNVGSGGDAPAAGLTDMGGVLFGATSNGGKLDSGTVFSYTPKTGQGNVLSSIPGSCCSLLQVGKTLYGTTVDSVHETSSVFALNPASGQATTLYSVKVSGGLGYLSSPLLHVGNALYGTTCTGGHYGAGTVYAVNLYTGKEKDVYTFTGGIDGRCPVGSMLSFEGALYGTTERGGTNTYGTVFEVIPSSGKETVIHSFACNGEDGAGPLAGLLNVGGIFYGTTSFGGANLEPGAIFSVNPVTGQEKVVYSFTGNFDGFSPQAPLIDVGGVLYGTTTGDGDTTFGTVFRFSP